ncbi:MAG TPA: type III pantothenate kinase [Spirochaetota bacterium]|nr:type III pantothenate kinase [Spirochaetota bacterium]
MILTIDIGNSYLKAACFDNNINNCFFFKCLSETLTRQKKFLNLLQQFFSSNHINTAALKSVYFISVKPSLNKHLIKVLKQFKLQPVMVTTDDLKHYIGNYSGTPGVDRIIAIAGIKHLYSFPAVVIDFGTAITIDYFNEKSYFAGGMILPGIKTAFDSIRFRTELIKKTTCVPPEKILGHTTAQAVNSGIFTVYTEGIAAAIRKIIKTKNNTLRPAAVIASGGEAAIGRDYIKEIKIYEPQLILKSLFFYSQKKI